MKFVTLARQNLRNRYNMTRIFYYNRASTGCDEEFHTFHDEWCMGDFNDGMRDNHTAWEVKIVPTESYIDFVLYWYGKSFDIAGNTGVYIDNNFFSASYNTQMTGAYQREDGSIMPSTGIWGLRELAKRTFVYLNERGMRPINMVHMTSAQILPLNSFYTVQYDWEWHLGEGDAQGRFSRIYLQLVSNGEHAGNWPILLHDQGRFVDDPWIFKTFLGVAITHELLIDRYVWHGVPTMDGDTTENRLFNTFREPINRICRQPEVEVYRYWDQRPQPITANNPNLPGIVYALKGREALFAITSYAEGDEQVTATIDAAALDLAAGYRVIDLETNEEMQVNGDTLKIPAQQTRLEGISAGSEIAGVAFWAVQFYATMPTQYPVTPLT